MEGSIRGGNMIRSVFYACTTLAIVMLFLITIMSRQVLQVHRPLTEKCKGELCSRLTSSYQGDRGQALVCKSANKGCKDQCSNRYFRKHTVLESTVPCLSQETVNNIEKFVFFIGYARSGHSIIANMMDAHPNMIVANEFRIVKQVVKQETSWDKAFLFDELYRKSNCAATCGWRSRTLSLNESWLGRYTTLKVIGDKYTGIGSEQHAHSPLEFAKVYRNLSGTLNIPIRVIHVVRNPYDMIATKVLRRGGIHDQYVSGKLSITNKYGAGRKAMQGMTNHTFRRVKDVEVLIPALNLTVLEIHSADFIKDPKHTLRSVCTFLDLKCPEDYLQACFDRTYRSMSRTRDVLVWDEQLIEDIETRMKQHTFLRRYSFYSD